MNIEDIAKIVCNVNKEISEFYKDDSNDYWENVDDIIKESIIYGIKYHLKEPSLTPKESHDRWVEYKKNEGWIYGCKKDIKKKTHPCLVEYDLLPEFQKMKDILFMSIVKHLEPFIGQKLCKCKEKH